MNGMAARSLKLKDRLIATYAGLANTLPQPVFQFSLGWAKDYSALFRNEIEQRSGVDGLLDSAVRTGRVLLCGRGGSGKTTILRRAAVNAADRKMAVLLVNLRKWAATDESDWRALSGDATPRIDFLLSRFVEGPASVLELDWLSPSDAKVFIFDGLNEVPFDYGNQIIAAADEIAASLINASVIVSDRFVRRPLRAERWRFALVESLDESAIRKAWLDARCDPSILDHADANQKALLDSPFFLDEAIKDGLSSNRVSSLRNFFGSHSGLSDFEFQKAADAAYLAYETFRSRTFSFGDFETMAGSTTVTKLVQSNILMKDGDRSYFRHHLHHDFLASNHLARNPSLWNHNGFNVVTLKASSFDAIGLALGQAGPSEADKFVRNIYDWNPYAAAYALSPEEGRVEAIISKEMEHVVLCMLAERRWDPILATVQRAEDALAIFPTPGARRYLDAGSLADVTQIVSSHQSTEEWFLRWRRLFVHVSGPASQAEVDLISDLDGVLGWTAANVLKRLKLTQAQQRDLRAKADSETVSLRWRIAHVLGAFPSTANLRLLQKMLTRDRDEWVRYGAIRSLVEMAVHEDSDLRKNIFDYVAKNIRLLLTWPRVMEEFARAVVVRREVAPKGWVNSVGLVVGELLDRSSETSEMDRWARLLANLRATYGE